MAKSENGAAVTYVHDAAGEVLEGHIAFGAGKTRTKATKAKTKAPPLCSTSQKVVKQARDQALATGDDPKLAEHAAMIRRLGKRVIADIIEIGRRLQEAKALVGHGSWEAWLEREFSLVVRNRAKLHARVRTPRVSEDFKSKNFLDLTIASDRALPAGPEGDARRRSAPGIIDRAEAGEAIIVKTVKTVIKEAAATNGVRPGTDG